MRTLRKKRVAVAAGGAPEAGIRRVVEGAVHAVMPDGRVRVLTAGGQALACRVPTHVSLPWLTAALARGPVAAELTVGERGVPSLWSLFPGPEHDGVVADCVEVVASERIDLVCGSSAVTLERKDLRVRGRDVVVSGSRATRVRGGTIKLN